MLIKCFPLFCFHECEGTLKMRCKRKGGTRCYSVSVISGTRENRKEIENVSDNQKPVYLFLKSYFGHEQSEIHRF